MTLKSVIFRVVRQIVLVALAAIICWQLSLRIGRWPTVLVWSVVMAICCIGAAALLKSSPVGKVTWRNYPAGYFLPWGYILGRGQLPGIVATSWAVWTLIAIAVCILTTGPTGTPDTTPPAAATTTASASGARHWIVPLLFAAWVVNGAAALYMLNTLTKFTPGAGGKRTLFKLLAVIVGLVTASVVLWMTGRPGWALAVAGGPYAVLGACFGLFVLVMVTVGRNTRWN